MNADERFARFAKITLAVVSALVLFVTATSVGLLGNRVSFAVGQFFPEGWKLFAEGPQAPRFRAAKVVDDRWVDATRLPLAKPSNAFGLDRTVRWQNVEISRLVGEVPRLNAWTRCNAHPLRCLERTERTRVHRVTNRTPLESLCGRVGLIRQLIVPIERLDGGNPYRITHVVVLDVRC